MNALYRGLAVAGVLSLLAFYPVTQWLIPDNALAGDGFASRRSVAPVGSLPWSAWR